MILVVLSSSHLKMASYISKYPVHLKKLSQKNVWSRTLAGISIEEAGSVSSEADVMLICLGVSGAQ